MKKEETRPGLALDVIELAKKGDGLTTDIVGFFDKQTARPSEAITHIRAVEPLGTAYAACAPTEIEEY